MLIQLILISFIFGAVVQILYWTLIYSRLALFKVSKTLPSKEEQAVSVIICAKDEAANLSKNLPPILEQNYGNYEVLVVNDRSTDETASILANFQKKYPHLNVLTLQDENRAVKGKKYALSKGIRASKYELLLLTDADCMPSSPDWIRLMQAHISGEKTIGIAYAPMFKGKGLLSLVSRLETTQTAFQYLSIALLGLPYMGVGRNLMYKKSLFHKNNGFENHDHIASGDDDLFINQVANKKNTSIILHPKTFMYSESKKDFKSYMLQKSRHLSTSPHYRPIHIFLLGLYPASLFFLHLYPIILLIMGFGLKLVALFYTIRLIIMWLISYFNLKKLKVSELWWCFPLLDILYLLYLVILSPSIIFRNTTKWK